MLLSPTGSGTALLIRFRLLPFGATSRKFNKQCLTPFLQWSITSTASKRTHSPRFRITPRIGGMRRRLKNSLRSPLVGDGRGPSKFSTTGRRPSPRRRFGTCLSAASRDLRNYALEFGAGAVRGNCRGYCCSYLPIIRMVNEPGTAAPWGPRPPPGGGGGAGPRSWLIVKMWFVWLSNVIVQAPFIVARFCSTSKLAGLFSLTTVNVPLPCVPSPLPNCREKHGRAVLRRATDSAIGGIRTSAARNATPASEITLESMRRIYGPRI